MTSKKVEGAAGKLSGFDRYYLKASLSCQLCLVVRCLFPEEKQGVRMASLSRLNKS
jgi:hypothetical protein